MQNKNFLLSFVLLVSIVLQSLPVTGQTAVPAIAEPTDGTEPVTFYSNLIRSSDGFVLPEAMFGDDGERISAEFQREAEAFVGSVVSAGGERTENSLEKAINDRKAKPGPTPVVNGPVKKPVPAKGRRRASLHTFQPTPQVDWRSLAFGFASFTRDEKPEIKMTETDKEIKAEGTDKKSFETKDAKGTRTQKSETKYTKDGKTFGVEIKDTQVIEAVSKPDGKSFRREISLMWGAEVAACPDANGMTAGTGKAKVISKTTYSEGGPALTMTSEFDLQAKLTGHVDDEAKMMHYDLQLDANTTNSGYEAALKEGLIKEIKIKDGRYGLHYDIPGNTIEVSDGQYGAKRTPAKMGNATAQKLTPMNDADTELIGKAIGPMVPSIWNSANEKDKTAERHWRNYGCVEVISKVPKLTLEPGEEVRISAETVHLQDSTKINAQMTGEAYEGEITPEQQAAKPGATFSFTKTGEGAGSFHVESVSKRGIGKGDVEFQLKKEDEEPAAIGAWTGTISVEREQREEREKRSGANLAENGGHLETTTNVELLLTGRLDRTVDATNAFIANISGRQETVDYEYDRYKIDEGYCGPNAVPYKGPKEITRTSRTIANYSKETRVFVDAGAVGGTITFSLPEISGTTIHSYVHRSPCAEHDRANTNEATNDDAPTTGGSFSFSFTMAPGQKSAKGTITVNGEDGSVTVYRWELTRQ
jgi:hypothetical protein